MSNSWLKKTLKINSYFEMDNLSEEVNSSEGLSFFPFGNGSERLFNHKIRRMYVSLDSKTFQYDERTVFRW